jgi:alpha-ketoglutarate-dependent taurine dioxygenase
MTAALNDCAERSPFALKNEGEYQAWRARKLALAQRTPADRVFELDADGRIPQALMEALRLQISAHNFAIFESPKSLDKADFLALNRQFGLHRVDSETGVAEDGVTSLRVVEDSDRLAQYIPYTNRALGWHTDGYYNPPHRRINAFALYCVSQAGRGGGNYLFDHELLYIQVRDRAPGLLEALMAEDLMRIPANLQDNRIVRAEETGPVFSLQFDGCSLHMRYTSRPRNIVWKADKRSEQALNLVREILVDGRASVDIRLQAGQGIVCNNILHGRQAFHNLDFDPARLVYRARYHDSIDFDRQPTNAASLSRV